VENYDVLNVSLTTEHWTDEIRRSYAMNYRFSGVQRKTSYQRLLSYRIDPEAPLGRRLLASSI
jgi:hypothetical protein